MHLQDRKSIKKYIKGIDIFIFICYIIEIDRKNKRKEIEKK
jgi:hypothetical protein